VRATRLIVTRMVGEKRHDEIYVAGTKAAAGQFLVAVNVDELRGRRMLWTLRVRDAGDNVVDEVRAAPHFPKDVRVESTWGALDWLHREVPAVGMQYLRRRAGFEP
jgi:hypothetical protein